MSIPVLTQVYDEVRRLSIAGSVVASGDFRLKKLIPPLEQAGQKAPVFAKVAHAATKLVDSTEQTSAEALLDLSTLVNAILYTQGETGREGKLATIETTNLGAEQTQASARVLKPLLEALTTTGSGRHELIREAYERGAFKDLRLVKPALAALDDTYSEISDLVATKILPMYGKAILPELVAKFDQKGRAGHVRRLKLMHQLDPAGTREIVKRALDEGSKEVRIGAIECLGEDAEDLAFLLEQAKSKAKDVRAAALSALGKSKAKEAGAMLEAALKSADIDLAVEAVRSSPIPALHTFVLAETAAAINHLLTSKEKDKAAVGKNIRRVMQLLRCLYGRTDKPTEALLIDLFGKRAQLAAIKGEPSGQDLVEWVSEVMANGPKKAQAMLIDAHAELSEEELDHALEAAILTRKPTEVFEMFSPYLRTDGDGKKKRKDAAADKRDLIIATLAQGWRYRGYYGLEDIDDSPASEVEKKLKDLDPRWLDLAVELRIIELVQVLARPGHPGASALLEESFAAELKKAKHAYHFAQLLETMVRIEHPAATDSVIAALKKSKGDASYSLYWVAHLIGQLPKSALPKLEELVPTLPDNVIDLMVHGLTQLKAKK